MTALASLSKFYGCYDKWLQIRQRYNLKWSSGNNSLQSLQRFFDSDLTLDSMIFKIKGMIAVLPANMAAIVRFACITGLRPSEAVESAKLVQDNDTFADYYDPSSMTLCHYKFKNQFLRATKKAYISYITLDNLQPIRLLEAKKDSSSIPSQNAIRLAVKRKGLPMEMHLTRKIFASYLRNEGGIQSEAIDLLQGRVPPSVLTRHYLSPPQNLKDKVLDAVESLKRQL